MQLSSAFFLALAIATVSGSAGTSESKTALGAAKPIGIGAASGIGAIPGLRARFVHGPYRRKNSYESTYTEGTGAAKATGGANSGEGYSSGNGSAQPSGSGEAPAESSVASPSGWTGGFGGNTTKTAEAGSATATGTGNAGNGAASASGAGVASATSISPAIPTGGAASLSNNGGTVAVAGLSMAFAVFM